MISFPKLGSYGRLGNQLFQYAFLRLTAQRLKTQFFCPKWDGDDIFDLQDESERTSAPLGIIHYYDAHPGVGFSPDAFSIQDNTEILGFFQSEKFYSDNQLVRKWYTFRDEIVTEAEKLYGNILKQDCVSFSLRIDKDYGSTREYFPLYPLFYYQNALSIVKPSGVILVFADRPDLAKDFFQPLKGQELIYVDNLNPAQQLYLMTRCRANVITNSTFAWWGGWLNSHPDPMVVAASAWCRPGVPNQITDILCDDWVKIPGTIPVWDHFQMWRVRHPIATIRRIQKRLFKSDDSWR